MSGVRIGRYGLNMPPFEQAVRHAAVAEQQGYDFTCYWDQLNGIHPSSPLTPDFNPLANTVPDMDVWFDPALTNRVWGARYVGARHTTT